MRYRRLPPVASLETLRTVWRAVPRSAAETEDCCGRICARTDVDRREDASDWLVFLTALGCVERCEAGYRRTGGEPDAEALADAFERSVLGVSELLAVLDGGQALAPAAAFDRLDEPGRRQIRRAGGERYVARLLGWAVVFGLADETGDGYT